MNPKLKMLVLTGAAWHGPARPRAGAAVVAWQLEGTTVRTAVNCGEAGTNARERYMTLMMTLGTSWQASLLRGAASTEISATAVETYNTRKLKLS